MGDVLSGLGIQKGFLKKIAKQALTIKENVNKFNYIKFKFLWFKRFLKRNKP